MRFQLGVRQLLIIGLLIGFTQSSILTIPAVGEVPAPRNRTPSLTVQDDFRSRPLRSPVPCAQSPRLAGSLIQEYLAKDWNQSQWREEFKRMKSACLTQLVIQWTADSKKRETYYPTSLAGYAQAENVDIVGPALTAAGSEEIEVFLGLQKNDDFDNGPRKFAKDAAWLDAEAQESIKVATDLFDRYHTTEGFKKCFRGYYLWFEFDNLNFPAGNWDNLVRFYTVVGNALHKLAPGKVIVIAPYFNVGSDPAPNSAVPSESLRRMANDWQAMLSYILKRSPVDVLALQDGVGAKENGLPPHATLPQLPTMFEATRRAIESTGKDIKFWADTETYVENREGKTGSYPMFIPEIVADIHAVQPFVSNYLSFSFNHYQSPYEGFFQSYKNYTEGAKLDNVAPDKPADLRVSEMDQSTVNLNWKAGTDNIGVVGYDIYRNNKKLLRTFVRDTGFGTAFIDNGLSAGTRYQYEIAAIDASGNESVRSNKAVITTTSFSLENVALSKPYSTTLASDPNYPDNGCVVEQGTAHCPAGKGLLTNGEPGLGLPIDILQWQGRNTGANYSFTIDLEDRTLIKEINSDWLQRKSSSISLPQQVTYYVSEDNVNFKEVGRVAKPDVSDADQVWRYRKTDLNINGRFVKIEVKPSQGWSFIGEAQVLQPF
jgi:hypothetical protein